MVVSELKLPEGSYPFKHHYLKLKNGLHYHYLDEGQGDPVVMVHGNPSWSFYYRNVVKLLKQDFRCIVPDHIGCGYSDKPDDTHYQFSLEERVNDLESLLENLGINKNITLILHDWGGMIGMAYASRHPQAIKKLVLLNTAAFHLPKEKKFPFLLKLSRTKLGEYLILQHNLFSRGAAFIGCTKNRLTPEMRDAFTAPYDNPKNRLATLRFVQDIPLEKSDRGFDLITQVEEKLSMFKDLPILICWGMKDFVFDVHFLNVWKKNFPKAQVLEFKDCGHYILQDAEAEVLKAIEKFLGPHERLH